MPDSPKNRPGARKKGHLFIISAPSGAGKTTLCRALRDRFADLRYSISHTTRNPRAGETAGVDYHFIDADKFRKKIEGGEWAEWAEVHGNYYGTAADFLNCCIDGGHDVLLDIDVQGMRQIVDRFPDGITIFIMPPSVEVLRQRMDSRGTDSPAVIERRMKNARAEMDSRNLYRHTIVNDRLDAAVAELAALIASYRSGRKG